MKILNAVSKVKIATSMKEQAKKVFTTCNPDRCPRCRISDG